MSLNQHRASSSFITLTLCWLMLSLGVASAQTASSPASFEATNCPAQMPAGVQADCGYLIVPEDHSNPDGPTIRLAVAILRHPSGDPVPDPLIYLEGGPGGSTLKRIGLTYSILFQGVHEASNRDLILFDQRGVGLSQPALECPNAVQLQLSLFDYELDGQDLTLPEITSLLTDANRDCLASLAETYNVVAFNSRNSAADVEALRLALGYEQVNLWGISYGSKLALNTLRDYPGGVRSAIIDAVLPLEADFIAGIAPDVDETFSAFFAYCAADADCAEAYPDLESTFWATVDRLNAEPVRINATDFNTGRRFENVVFDGTGLVALLFQFLYQTEIIPLLPSIITEIANNNYASAELLVALQIGQFDFISIGMNQVFNCYDEVAFADLAAIEAIPVEYPRLAEFMQTRSASLSGLAVCDALPAVEIDPQANEPVISDIPTLVFNGDLDPITRPAAAERAASNLSNSTLFIFPGTGHGASPSDPCAFSIVGAFLADPTASPDGSCIAEMDKPRFSLPTDAPAPVTLVRRELADGATADLPEGWSEVQPGIFARQATGLDQASLSILPPTPASESLFISSISISLGVTPEEVTSITAETGALWNIYSLTFAGFPGYMALTTTPEGVRAIILTGNDAADAQALYEMVLLPVVGSYLP